MKNNDRLVEAFRVMGLNRNASLKELKKVFHEKAMQYHPDLNPSPAAAEEFKTITNAYDIIKTHMKEAKKAAAPAAAPKPKRPEPKKMREEYVKVGEITRNLSPQELMFRVANSQNLHVRVHAIRALAELGGRDAAWCLIRSLQDPEIEVRRAAVSALGYMRARFAAAPLIHLHRTCDVKTSELIIDALYDINSPMAAKFLAGMAASKAAGKKDGSASDIA